MTTSNICTTPILEKIIKETDIAHNLLLPHHHLIENTKISEVFYGII